MEIARVHFARCMDAGFADDAALRDLRESTRSAADAVLGGQGLQDDACALVVGHCIALSLTGQCEQARSLLAAAAAVYGGALAAQLALLERCVVIADGAPARSTKCPLPTESSFAELGIPTSAAAASGTHHAPAADNGQPPPPMKSARTESSGFANCGDAVPSSLTWLTQGSCGALLLLMRLVDLQGAGKHAEAAETFRKLAKTCDNALRAINAASNAGIMTATANAELRLLVGVKLSAFFELAVGDMISGEYSAAASKLDALATFMLVFLRHTVHFSTPFHAAAACLAHLLRQHQAADAHLAALQASTGFGRGDDQSGTSTAVTSGALDVSVLSFVLSAYGALVTKDRETFEALMMQYTLGGESRSAGNNHGGGIRVDPATVDAINASPRYSILVGLLVGHHNLNQRDWRSASTTLKKVASAARDAHGVASPIVATALRLLAEAHTQSGNPSGSEAAATMATQVATMAADGVGLAQCLAWTLSRMPEVLSPADADRRSTLVKAHTMHLVKYDDAVRAALASDATQRVLRFLPTENDEYKRWLSRIREAAAAGGSRSSTSVRKST
jgi:hypothetical protein